MARETGLCHDTSESWRVGGHNVLFLSHTRPGPSRPSPAGPATVDRLGWRAWLALAPAAAAGPYKPQPLPPARPPGRRPGHRGNAEEEGGARGLTRSVSRHSPNSADPRPPLPLRPAGAPRPSLTPRVRRLLHHLLLLLPPLGRGSGSGSGSARRRRRRRPRERRRRRLLNAHARSTQAPPPRPPRPSESPTTRFRLRLPSGVLESA